MTATRSKGLSSWQKTTLIALSVLACCCVLSVVTIISINSFPLTHATAPTVSPLPPHVVNDLFDNSNMVDYYIVVDKSFTKADAMKLINYYQSQHSGYGILNIIFFCDKAYAQEKYISNDSPISDSELYKHILYWYQTGEWSWKGTHFVVDIANPDFTNYPTLASDCR